MTDAPVIACRGLEKTYRDFWGRRRFPALRGIDLEVAPGESFALLGPNGSGKTTTLRLWLGLLRPTAGEVRLFGRSPTDAGARRGVGFLPERSALQGFLTCSETLTLHARLQGVPKAERTERIGGLLERVGLLDASKKRVHELSHGMRRRLALAVALVGAPQLLVLDEPTAGMDPLVREGVLELFREHVEDGGTLVVTSHLLGDISGIAERAALLATGRVARSGRLDDLLRRDGLRDLRVRGGPEIDAIVAKAVAEAGGEVESAAPARATIEELFLETYRETYRAADESAEGAPSEDA